MTGLWWKPSSRFQTAYFSVCPHTVEEGKGTFSLVSVIKSLNSFMRASLVAQRLKCLPPMQEMRVWSLGWEDPPEKETATHSSILAWRIPWSEEPGRLQSIGSQRVRHDWVTSLSSLPGGSEEPGGLQSMESQKVGHNWVTNTFFHFQGLITSQRTHLLIPSY